MSSLGFDLLDRHVVDGGADDLAGGSLTFARLLERSAALARGLLLLGVVEGDEVAVRVIGEDRLVAVCACTRIGAVPVADEADVVVEVGPDGAAQVRTREGTHPLDLVRRAGSGDPAAALADDADGYRDAVRARAADVVDALLARRPAL